MEKISAVVITKNEELNIEACLRSISFADEIIVVDAASNDRTVEIAKRFTKKIFIRKWDNYANQKNFGIDRTRNRWVLSIDADERASFGFRQEIERLKYDKDGYLLPLKNYFLGRWLKRGGQYPDHHLRLFKKNQGRFLFNGRQVHEGVYLKTKNTGRTTSGLDHYSYTNIYSYFRKFNNYTYLDALGRFESGETPSYYGLFFRPVHRLFKWYVFKLGLLDGVHGLVFHTFSAFYYFICELKLFEYYEFKTGELKWRR
ncbi:MAG: glycosyltransferase family 2 protein [Candidatus Firestonebacteria bacterium]